MSNKLTKEELSALTKEELINLVFSGTPKPPVEVLASLDKKTYEKLKKTYNLLTSLRNFYRKVPIELYISFYNNKSWEEDYCAQHICIDVCDDYYHGGNAGAHDIMTDPNTKDRIEQINAILKKTRKIVADIAQKAGIEPLDFWKYLESQGIR